MAPIDAFLVAQDLDDAETARPEGKKAIQSSKLTTKFAFPKDRAAAAAAPSAKSVPDLSPAAPLGATALPVPQLFLWHPGGGGIASVSG